MIGKMCHGKPMAYESGEFTDSEGRTIRTWSLRCVVYGCRGEYNTEVVEGRPPMGWLERHRADKEVSKRLADFAPFSEANFPD